MRFLIRSFSDIRGYTEVEFRSGALPRTRQESYVPWAMASDRVVYARTGEHNSWRSAGSLRPYDSTVSQFRRRLAESALGSLALSNPTYTSAAVGAVSAGVKRFLISNFFSNADRTAQIVYDEIGHYFFTAGGMGFGRISTADKSGMKPKAVFAAIVDTLSDGSLQQKLAVHDAVGRKLLTKLSGGPNAIYDQWGPTLRGDWFDDKDRRGRVNAPTRSAPTALAGTLGSSSIGILPNVDQSRNRGVDMFVRDLTRKQHPEANAYYDDLDARNLLFGAGISGTTGTLLQAALAFGKLSPGEMLKQYTLAIIGYLVGGGMHSYHETMAIAAKAGVPYTPGAFIDSLPTSFTGSHDFKTWSQQYYDIVFLGAIHWRNNSGALPSHLNAKLRA